MQWSTHLAGPYNVPFLPEMILFYSKPVPSFCWARVHSRHQEAMPWQGISGTGGGDLTEEEREAAEVGEWCS